VTDAVFKTDLRLVLPRSGQSDAIDLAHDTDAMESVGGIDNLAQALTVRLLVDQGELTDLGHPHYGSRIRELLGANLDRANLELMRRYVRQTLMSDPRVAEVVEVRVEARHNAPGIVDVETVVQSVSGESMQIGVSLNVS